MSKKKISNTIATRFIAAGFLMLILQSCQRYQALPNALEKYSNRMYKVLDLEQKDIPTFSTLAFEDKSAFAIDLPELNIKMREFYAIDSCAIKQLIAERNTALGKIQLPSVRLSYEWKLIELLRECIKSDVNAENEVLTAKMQDWLSQKQTIFPLIWANMLTQSDEFYLGISSSGGFIDGNEKDNFTEGLFDLKNVIAIKNDQASNIVEMEASLKSIQQHRIYARLWRSQILLRDYLQKMTVDISAWASTFTCHTRKDKEKLAIIRQVFTLFFINEVQSIAAQINKYHYAFKPEFLKISGDENLPRNFTSTIERYNQSAFDEYQHAMLAHINMWQRIFKKCD